MEFCGYSVTKNGIWTALEELGEECVSMASMSVLVNGSPSKPFHMERGLRQGDPLSPFLFVLVVDVLHRMLEEAVRNGRIALLLVGGEHIALSHLQFADDTILFCPSACGLLGCNEAVLPVRYLGIPLGANPRLVKTWKPILDKVEEKLSQWKAKVLSKAGKLVLIKSVLNSLPIYYLSLYRMPKAVADKLIALQRRFMWCKGDGNDGIPLVKWGLVQAPKKAGGLGIGDAMLRNTALLFKWWWRFSKEDCSLWKRIVCSCNNLNSDAMLATQQLPNKGGPWKDICHLNITEQRIKDKMLAGLVMEVLQSETMSVWRGVVPPRIELFGWFVLVGRVNTKERLSKISVIPPADNICVWCSWLRVFGEDWAIPGTIKELFESWTSWHKRKEEQKRWLTAFFAVI
ncbi:uncharacterized protein LOC107486010 [Arachis duranensis]|uniref:Uncharacterized protein LOC107486010 n=1 Tax=Arachis duranensis TaxID=130453 RepID=A0A6P4D3Z6_ARADU|nr:uncharacterized protein LOC107486010 [Arachis duranensis]